MWLYKKSCLLKKFIFYNKFWLFFSSMFSNVNIVYSIFLFRLFFFSYKETHFNYKQHILYKGHWKKKKISIWSTLFFHLFIVVVVVVAYFIRWLLEEMTSEFITAQGRKKERKCFPLQRILHFLSMAFRRDAFFDGLKIIVPFDFVNVGLNAPTFATKRKTIKV